MGEPWEVWKECLLPGRVVVPGPDGRPFAHTFTPGEVRDAGRTSAGVLEAGYHIPLNWEHQDNEPDRVRLSAVPASALRARGIFGFLKRFRLNPAGRLEALCGGDDPDDLRRFAKVKFVSPEVQWGWRDSDGRVWDGPVITHLAATGRPVQPHQAPLPPARLGHGSVGRTIRLSLEDYTPAGTQPMAGMFDDDSDPTAPAAGTQRTPWERIAAALGQYCNLKLGDVSTVKDPEDFATRVEIAAMNRPADDAGDDEPDGDEMGLPADDGGGDMAAPPPGAAPAAPPPMQMSLDAQAKRLDAFARKNLSAEVADLERTRRVGPAVAADLKARVKAVKLSFTPDGELAPNDLTVRIDAYKRLEPRWDATGRKKARLSHGRQVAGPSPYQEAANPADDDAVVASFEEAVNRS